MGRSSSIINLRTRCRGGADRLGSIAGTAIMAGKKPSPIGETIKNEAGEPIGHRSVYGVHKWEVYVDRADKPPSAIERSLDKERN